MKFKYLGCFLLECRRFDDILHPFLALICNIEKQLRKSNSDICSIYIYKTLDNEFEDDWYLLLSICCTNPGTTYV